LKFQDNFEISGISGQLGPLLMNINALDFSKAFDTVKHSTLVRKLTDFPQPDNIFHWLTDYLSERKHQTKFNGRTSSNQ